MNQLAVILTQVDLATRALPPGLQADVIALVHQAWHHQEECTYLNCIATSERDWLLAEAPDEERDYFFAIRAIEAARVQSLQPINGKVFRCTLLSEPSAHY